MKQLLKRFVQIKSKKKLIGKVITGKVTQKPRSTCSVEIYLKKIKNVLIKENLNAER